MGFFDFLKRKPRTREQLLEQKRRIEEKLTEAKTDLEHATGALARDSCARRVAVWENQLKRTEEAISKAES